MKERSARDYKEFLRGGRWFAGLPDALQEALLGAGRVRAVGGGARLFSRGDPPSGLYAVLDGTIRISGIAPSGKEALLVLLEPPNWFGEIAVFDGLPRTHDAVANGDAIVLHVPAPALQAILDGEPTFWRELGRLVAGKLRLAFTAIEDLAMLPIPMRLARRLVWMAEGYGERRRGRRRAVEVSQDELALMLATSRQTANQLLKELEAQGLVRLSYGEIEIVDLDGLRRVAALDD